MCLQPCALPRSHVIGSMQPHKCTQCIEELPDEWHEEDESDAGRTERAPISPTQLMPDRADGREPRVSATDHVDPIEANVGSPAVGVKVADDDGVTTGVAALAAAQADDGDDVSVSSSSATATSSSEDTTDSSGCEVDKIDYTREIVAHAEEDDMVDLDENVDEPDMPGEGIFRHIRFSTLHLGSKLDLGKLKCNRALVFRGVIRYARMGAWPTFSTNTCRTCFPHGLDRSRP